MFGRKSQEEREQEGKQKLDQIAQGKGLTGKLSQAFLGAEGTAQVQAANAAVQGQDAAAAMAAGGVTPVDATVVSIEDTGATINDNPMVRLTLDVNGTPVVMETMVSRLQIPRAGDACVVMPMPGQPSGYVWGGLKP